MPDQDLLLDATVRIVTAAVGRGMWSVEETRGLIAGVHDALAALGRPAAVAPALTPAVPVAKSVRHDHIVCLEDGRQLKTLKRHLANAYNMTPDEYRAKWNLPASYPMVAPAYAEKRRALAKSIGLGHLRNRPEAA